MRAVKAEPVVIGAEAGGRRGRTRADAQPECRGSIAVATDLAVGKNLDSFGADAAACRRDIQLVVIAEEGIDTPLLATADGHLAIHHADIVGVVFEAESDAGAVGRKIGDSAAGKGGARRIITELADHGLGDILAGAVYAEVSHGDRLGETFDAQRIGG